VNVEVTDRELVNDTTSTIDSEVAATVGNGNSSPADSLATMEFNDEGGRENQMAYEIDSEVLLDLGTALSKSANDEATPLNSGSSGVNLIPEETQPETLIGIGTPNENDVPGVEAEGPEPSDYLLGGIGLLILLIGYRYIK
jgi:hypothetical protein